MRSTLGWLGQVLAWLVILGVVVLLAVAVVIPRIAGATPYTVLTGSMRPGLPPGTLVVIKPVETSELRTGDVATYQIESGKPTVATHRIIAVGANLKGETSFTFQGDANNAPDLEPVLPVQIKGKLWYSVPYLGYVNNALNGAQRQIAVLVVSTLLIGYAAFMFVGAIRDRRQRRKKPSQPKDKPEEVTESTTSSPASELAGSLEVAADAQEVRTPEKSRAGAAPYSVPLVLAAAALLGFLLLARRRRHRQNQQST